MPFTDFYNTGGLEGVQASQDLTGDGLPDVVAYRGQTLFRFDGATGALTKIDAGKTLDYVETMHTGPGTGAVVCSTVDGVMVSSGTGNILWAAGYSSWSDVSPPGGAHVLDDINGDGINDLAVFFPDRIVILESQGNSSLSFDILRTVLPADGVQLDFLEITADIDGDGIGDIAYYEYNKENKPSPGNTGDTEYMAMVIVSPASGKVILRVFMERQASFEPACGDFDGDGYADTLAFWAEATIASPYSVLGPGLEVFSGSDGRSLWHLDFAVSATGRSGSSFSSAISDSSDALVEIPAAVVRFPGVEARDCLAVSTKRSLRT